MIDLYLKAPTEEQMLTTLEELNIGVHNTSIDFIGSFSKILGEEEDGTPIIKEYPDFHCNLRGHFTEEQLEALAPFIIQPPEAPFRVWG